MGRQVSDPQHRVAGADLARQAEQGTGHSGLKRGRQRPRYLFDAALPLAMPRTSHSHWHIRQLKESTSASDPLPPVASVCFRVSSRPAGIPKRFVSAETGPAPALFVRHACSSPCARRSQELVDLRLPQRFVGAPKFDRHDVREDVVPHCRTRVRQRRIATKNHRRAGQILETQFVHEHSGARERRARRVLQETRFQTKNSTQSYSRASGKRKAKIEFLRPLMAETCRSAARVPGAPEHDARSPDAGHTVSTDGRARGR